MEKKIDLRGHQHPQLAAQARTLPNTPILGPSESPVTPAGGTLNRIKSLGRIDVRASIVPRNSVLVPEGTGHHERLFSEQSSLYTSRTNHTIVSKILNILPDKFYAVKGYYNDFTTIDWAKAFILANRFNYELHHNRWETNNDNDTEPENGSYRGLVSFPFYYRAYLVLGKWVLIVSISFLFSLIAFLIDKIEIVLVGFKHGYCRTNWFASQVSCCLTIPESSGLLQQLNNVSLPSPQLYMNVFRSGYVFRTQLPLMNANMCADWVSWSQVFQLHPWQNYVQFDFVIYVVLTLILAYCACVITLSTKITSRFAVKLKSDPGNSTEIDAEPDEKAFTSRILYTACGSGVPEVKTILSGFVIRRFLGTYTLFAKTITLILAIASGMSLGKEGPYVHLATSVGNIMTRFFPHINNNEFMKKQILSASASSGVALAFGSPLGGVLFILEEINHNLPSHQLFQIFFCAIMSTLFLKFLNPYGTGKTVLFELQYSSDWRPMELVFFVIIGVAGGIFGAAFVKFVNWWPKNFRELKLVKNHPVFEVFLVSLFTGVVTFWNPYTKQASSELVLDLATPCTKALNGLCPSTHDQFVSEMKSLVFAFVVKILLTFITFGLKLPCGIYVPSMVVGALFGRIFAMFIQWCNHTYNLNLSEQPGNMEGGALVGSVMKYICAPNSRECVDLGIYSMISAGAFMAGVTRMNITLVTILFELTSSYTYVLPIAIAIAVANWLGSLLEKNSLYESLLIINDYPFMSSETEALNPFVSAGDVIKEMHTFENGAKHQNRESADSDLDLDIDIEEHERVEMGHSSGTVKMKDIQRDRFYIDITESPYISSQVLEEKLLMLAEKSLLDGCVPLIKKGVCIGLIYFSELELCLDKLKQFSMELDIADAIYCKLSRDYKYSPTGIWRKHQRHNQNLVRNYMHTNRGDYFGYGSNDDLQRETEAAVLQRKMLELSTLIKYVDFSPIFLNYDSELSLAHLIFDRIGTRVVILLRDGKYHSVLHKKVFIDYCRREN